MLAQPVDTVCKAKLDQNGLALDVAESAQAGPQRLRPARDCVRSPEAQVAYASDRSRWLRACGVRARSRWYASASTCSPFSGATRAK